MASTLFNTICLRRGTTAQNNAYLGKAGEITVDNELQSLRIHDGVRIGGYPLKRKGRSVLSNRSFLLWGYGTSQTTSGYGSDDRWANSHAGTGISKTHSQGVFSPGQTDVPGAKYYSSTAVVSSSIASDAYCLKVQRIPYVDTLAGMDTVASFSAKASVNALKIGIDLEQSFGSGGSSPVAVPGRIISLTPAWKRYFINFSIPPISGKTIGTDDLLRLRIWMSTGSNYNGYFSGETVGSQTGTFDIANIQLEAGNVASEFDPEDYFELSEYCRFFRQSGGFLFETPNAGTAAILNYFILPHQLRSVAAASIAFTDIIGNASKITERRNVSGTHNVTPTQAPAVTTMNGEHCIYFYHRNTSSAINGIGFNYTISSEL